MDDPGQRRLDTVLGILVVSFTMAVGTAFLFYIALQVR